MDIFSLPTEQPKRNITIISMIVAAITTILFIIFLALYIHKNKEYNEVTEGLQEISRISGSQSSTIDDLVNESENLQYKISRLIDVAEERGDRIEELEDIIERAKDEMNTLVMHWNWEEDSWTISNDINNVSFVLNEY